VSKGNAETKAGADGVKVWDLKTRKQITVPQQPFNERSQVSCVCWVTRRNETVDALCYGNGLGFLVFLQHRATEVSSQSCLFIPTIMLGRMFRAVLKPFILLALLEVGRLYA